MELMNCNHKKKKKTSNLRKIKKNEMKKIVRIDVQKNLP